MTLLDWADRWGVPAAALLALRADVFGAVEHAPPVPPSVHAHEAAVQVRLRLDASRAGWRVFRNNVGAGTVDGQFLRWGLANDSTRMNDSLKSSDLVGLRPVTIRQQDVGTVIGQFVSLEAKRVGWKYSGTAREVAQMNWLKLVASLGGHARFTTGEIE